jgi:hypothetical protein
VFAGVHVCLVSAGQKRVDVPPYPCKSPHGSARVFPMCSTWAPAGDWGDQRRRQTARGTSWTLTRGPR